MKGIPALLLALSLALPSSAQTGPPVDRGFLERCMGQVGELPAWDDGTKWEGGLLIFATAVAGAELLRVLAA